MDRVIEALIYLLYKKGVISVDEFEELSIAMFKGDAVTVAAAIKKVANGEVDFD